jgi:hypothetical protein
LSAAGPVKFFSTWKNFACGVVAMLTLGPGGKNDDAALIPSSDSPVGYFGVCQTPSVLRKLLVKRGCISVNF